MLKWEKAPFESLCKKDEGDIFTESPGAMGGKLGFIDEAPGNFNQKSYFPNTYALPMGCRRLRP